MTIRPLHALLIGAVASAFADAVRAHQAAARLRWG